MNLDAFFFSFCSLSFFFFLTTCAKFYVSYVTTKGGPVKSWTKRVIETGSKSRFLLVVTCTHLKAENPASRLDRFALDLEKPKTLAVKSPRLNAQTLMSRGQTQTKAREKEEAKEKKKKAKGSKSR